MSISFEYLIQHIKGLALVQKNGYRNITFEWDTTIEHVAILLRFLSKQKISFHFFDSLYPSPSDPGAQFSYSQFKNDIKNCWSMTLGNHGWSGGIYTIEEKIVVIQIYNLIKNGQLSTLKIDQKSFGSSHRRMNIEKNSNFNAHLLAIHANWNKIYANSLTFGIYRSLSLDTYKIFRLTPSALLVDISCTWHSKRFTKNNYEFTGVHLSNEQFLAAKELLRKIPVFVPYNKFNRIL